MSKAVKVYTAPRCIKCNATKRWLDRRGIAYEVVDATESAELTEAIRERAVKLGEPAIMPLVEVHSGLGTPPVQWFDFRPDLLEQHFSVVS